MRVHGMQGYISFDHDLGENERTGYDIAKLLVDLDMNGEREFALPAEFEFYVHSQNPIGKANIEAYLNNYRGGKRYIRRYLARYSAKPNSPAIYP